MNNCIHKLNFDSFDIEKTYPWWKKFMYGKGYLRLVEIDALIDDIKKMQDSKDFDAMKEFCKNHNIGYEEIERTELSCLDCKNFEVK